MPDAYTSILEMTPQRRRVVARLLAIHPDQTAKLAEDCILSLYGSYEMYIYFDIPRNVCKAMHKAALAGLGQPDGRDPFVLVGEWLDSIGLTDEVLDA